MQGRVCRGSRGRPWAPREWGRGRGPRGARLACLPFQPFSRRGRPLSQLPAGPPSSRERAGAVRPRPSRLLAPRTPAAARGERSTRRTFTEVINSGRGATSRARLEGAPRERPTALAGSRWRPSTPGGEGGGGAPRLWGGGKAPPPPRRAGGSPRPPPPTPLRGHAGPDARRGAPGPSVCRARPRRGRVHPSPEAACLKRS